METKKKQTKHWSETLLPRSLRSPGASQEGTCRNFYRRCQESSTSCCASTGAAHRPGQCLACRRPREEPRLSPARPQTKPQPRRPPPPPRLGTASGAGPSPSRAAAAAGPRRRQTHPPHPPGRRRCLGPAQPPTRNFNHRSFLPMQEVTAAAVPLPGHSPAVLPSLPAPSSSTVPRPGPGEERGARRHRAGPPLPGRWEAAVSPAPQVSAAPREYPLLHPPGCPVPCGAGGAPRALRPWQRRAGGVGCARAVPVRPRWTRSSRGTGARRVVLSGEVEEEIGVRVLKAPTWAAAGGERCAFSCRAHLCLGDASASVSRC